jgi:zinc/manganese transport system ATP-binding protein/zinc transport system ATP-binding protein
MAPAAIELASVRGGYGAEPVITDVSVRIAPGHFVGIIGPSGAGKTSILRAILGSLPWLNGSVMVAGEAVDHRRRPAGVGYVPQVQTVDWTFPATVEDVVLMGRIQRMGPWPWPGKRDRAAVAAVLERLGLGGLGRRQIRDLSGGQQQRVFLARALAGEPYVLLLDEPTASVDVATREAILAELWTLHQRGVTIVLTTHELNAVAAHLPWLVSVNRTVIAEGPPHQVLTELILRRTFDATIRVLRDPVTGAPLVVDGAGQALSRAAD